MARSHGKKLPTRLGSIEERGAAPQASKPSPRTKSSSDYETRSDRRRSTGLAAAQHGAARIEGMLQGLRGAGLKLTPQRMAIIRELAIDHSHPTAQALFERLKPVLPTMSFATVYNILAALSERGLCAVRALERGPVRFDPNVAPHDHAVCDGCGVVVDVEVAEPFAVRSRALGTFAVRTIERIYRGFCVECADQKRQPPGADQERGN